jgi:hypothetical protein
LEAAGGKNVEVFSPTIGRQLLERGLIDEIDAECSNPTSPSGSTPASQRSRKLTELTYNPYAPAPVS